MRREEHRPGRSLTVGFILVATGVVLAGTIPPVLSAQPAPAPKEDDHDADRAAILAVMKSLPQAFEKADAKAIAATWTAEGEYIADDGTTLHGREALEKAYGEFFKQNPKVTLDYESESLRFVARDTAVGEGYATLHRVPSEPPTVSRVSTLFAREDGQWRIALLREWPDEEASLRELSWLIGSWSSQEGDRPVQTTYEWEGEKAFIRALLGRAARKAEVRHPDDRQGPLERRTAVLDVREHRGVRRGVLVARREPVARGRDGRPPRRRPTDGHEHPHQDRQRHVHLAVHQAEAR